MAQAVKFMFDSLSQETDKPRPAQPKVRMVPETDLDVARQLAFEEGRAAGRAEAEAGVERSLLVMLEEVASGAARLLGALEHETRAGKVEAAGLALAVARKLSGRLLARAPLVEIEGMLAEALADHHDEPRLVVRLDEQLLDTMRRRLDPLLARNNFTGRVILIGEPGFAGADCRIEWPDGGVERRSADIEAAVDALFAKFAALSDSPAPAATTPES